MALGLSRFPIAQAVGHVRLLATVTSLLRVIHAYAVRRAISPRTAWVAVSLACLLGTHFGTARMVLRVLGALQAFSRTCSGLAAISVRFSTQQTVESVSIVQMAISLMPIGPVATGAPPIVQRLTASASSAKRGKSLVLHRLIVWRALLAKLESEVSVLCVATDGSRLRAESYVKNAAQVELVLVVCVMSSVLVVHNQIRIARIARPAWWDASVHMVCLAWLVPTQVNTRRTASSASYAWTARCHLRIGLFAIRVHLAQPASMAFVTLAQPQSSLASTRRHVLLYAIVACHAQTRRCSTFRVAGCLRQVLHVRPARPAKHRLKAGLCVRFARRGSTHRLG